MTDAKKIALRLALRNRGLTAGYNTAEGSRWNVRPSVIASLERAGLLARRGLDGDSGAARYSLTATGAEQAKAVGPLAVLAGTRLL